MKVAIGYSKGLLGLTGIVLLILLALWFPYRMIVIFVTEAALEWLDVLPFVFLESFGTVVILAILEGLRILDDLAKQHKSTVRSLQPLKRIRRYGILASGIMVVFMPVFFAVAQWDDAPGLAAFAILMLLLACLVVAVATIWHSVLEREISRNPN